MILVSKSLTEYKRSENSLLNCFRGNEDLCVFALETSITDLLSFKMTPCTNKNSVFGSC